MNGPTFNSADGIVRLNACPDVDMKEMEITAERAGIWEHAIPYAPAVPCATMLGDMSAYIAFVVDVGNRTLLVPLSNMMLRGAFNWLLVWPFTVIWGELRTHEPSEPEASGAYISVPIYQ